MQRFNSSSRQKIIQILKAHFDIHMVLKEKTPDLRGVVEGTP